jgi:ligand-binding sensor domain-containing protein
LGTWAGGISRFDGEHFTPLTTADGLVSDKVRPLVKDRQGDVWIGTDDAGLIRYEASGFTAL